MANPTPIQNPLKDLFRKPKLAITLPSKGNWYPSNSLVFNLEGTLDVFSLTAADNIKLRSGDPGMTGNMIADVISSCCPGIKNARFVPFVDIETLLLSIRVASFGDNLSFTVPVPKTSLTRELRLTSSELFSQFAGVEWDSEINIIDDNMSIYITVRPVSMSAVFAATKVLSTYRKDVEASLRNADKVDDEKFTTGLLAMAHSAIDIVCEGIETLKVIRADGSVVCDLSSKNPQDKAMMLTIIKNGDVAYYNALRDHIETQKDKYIFRIPVTSTEDERSAGADENWTAELNLIGSNFLPME